MNTMPESENVPIASIPVRGLRARWFRWRLRRQLRAMDDFAAAAWGAARQFEDWVPMTPYGPTPTRYPVETLDPEDDNGTMPSNVAALAETVIGHRIVAAEQADDLPTEWGRRDGLRLTLDDGRQVALKNSDDCCAYTELESFLLHPERVDHVILGVGTTEGYTRWHIYADAGDVLELTVGWSCGNPFYYGYGFDIDVIEPNPEPGP